MRWSARTATSTALKTPPTRSAPSAANGKPDGCPDSVYYLGNASRLQPAYPFEKYAPGWGDDVTAVECYMNASEQPDVTVSVELDGLSGSRLDKALAGMSVSIQKNMQKDNPCSIVFDGTGSKQTFWNLPVGTYAVSASDPSGQYVFSPTSVTTVRKGEDVNVTVRGVKRGEMGRADFFVSLDGSYDYDGGTLYYTVQDADGNRVFCGGGTKKANYGYTDTADGGSFSAALPAGEYKLSAAFMPAPAAGGTPKAEDMQKYTHLTQIPFSVSPGTATRVFETITAVEPAACRICFQKRSPDTVLSGRADVKPGSSVLTAEIYTQPLPEVMSRGGSLQPCLTASAKVSAEPSADEDPYDFLTVALAPGVYSVKVTATKSYKDEDYKGTSYGYGQLKVDAGGGSAVVFQQDSLDAWRVKIQVTDGSDPIPFADVKLRESDNLVGENWTRTYRADANGEVEVRLNLPANRLTDGAACNSYEIFARADGYNGGDWVQYAGDGVDANKEMTITTLAAYAGLVSKTDFATSAGYDDAHWITSYGSFDGIAALYYGTYFSTVGGSDADTYKAAIAKMDLWHQYGSRASFDLYAKNKKNNDDAVAAAKKAYAAVDKLRTDTAYPITLDLGETKTLDYVTFEVRDAETGAIITDRDTAVKEGEETSNHVFRTWYTNPGAGEVQINEIEDQSQSPWLQTGRAHVLKSAVAPDTSYRIEYTSTIGANGRNGDYMTFVQPWVSFTKDGATETHKLQYDTSDVAGSESEPYYIETMKLSNLSYLDDSNDPKPLIDDGISNITVQLWMEHKYPAVAGNGNCIRLVDANTGALIRAADSSIDVWTAASGGTGSGLHVDESVLLDKFTYGPDNSHYTAVPFPYSTLDKDVIIYHGDFPLGYCDDELGLGTAAVGVVAHAVGYYDSAYTLVPLHDLADKGAFYALYYVDIPMTPTSDASSWYTVDYVCSDGSPSPYGQSTVKSGSAPTLPSGVTFYKDRNLTQPFNTAKDRITCNTTLFYASSGTVTGVRVTAGSTSSVKQGESISVQAAVTGVGTFNSHVTWTVSPAGAAVIEDATASETTVTPVKTTDGKMYPFVLTATSEGDAGKSDSVCLYAYPADTAVNGYGEFYTVTVENAAGGGKRREGSVVTTVFAPVVAGKKFSEWKCDSTDVVLSSADTSAPTFTMPSHNVKLTAVYVSYAGGSGSAALYTLTFETNGGGALSPVTKAPGESVELAGYKPVREGYAFAGWFSDAALTRAVTSVSLTADATVYAKWTKTETANPFTDVPDGAYYHDAVIWAAGEKITGGTTPTTFAPFLNCSRGQVVTFLWRSMGSPEPAGKENPFTDVSPDAYYYKAVLWAVEQGITKGTGDTTFSPDKTVTRAQFVTFLWRLANSPAPKKASGFTDVTDPGAYYYNAVLWAAEQNITTGTTSTTFSPSGICSRGQVVTFLYRYFSR